MGYKLGLEAKLFHGAAGATASTEMKNVKDLTLDLSSGEADITTRATNGWRATAATLKEASLEWQMLWDPADTGFTAIKTAYFGNAPLALFVSDGDGCGLDADFAITGFSREEPLEEAQTVKVTAKPTFVTRPPSWKDGGGA